MREKMGTLKTLKGNWHISKIFTKQGHSMYQLIVKEYRKSPAIEEFLLNILGRGGADWLQSGPRRFLSSGGARSHQI